MLFRGISKLLDRIFVVLGALICMQVPLYMQQYRQQLIGRVDELTQQVAMIRQVSAESNKTLEQFIQKFMDDKDIDFSRQGVLMRNMVHRLSDLSVSFLAVEQASIWLKPMIFFRYLDYGIARSTLSYYQPGVLLTYEGMIYTLIGIFFGYMFYRIVVLRLFIFGRCLLGIGH